MSYCTGVLNDDFIFYLKNTDKKGNLLSGGVFHLLDSQDSLLEEIRADNGILKFPHIIPGNYTLVQVDFPSGYYSITLNFQIKILPDLRIFINDIPKCLFGNIINYQNP